MPADRLAATIDKARPTRRFGGGSSPPSRTPATPLEMLLLQRFLEMMGTPPIQFVLWNGATVGDPVGDPGARLHLQNRRDLWRLLTGPSVFFGDAYVDGAVDLVGDLVAFLESTYRALPRQADLGVLRKLAPWLQRPRPNTLAGSRRNIHHHYDIGNHFYRLWLDEQMQYTCAYFPDPSLGLEQAQRAKLDHVCRKLRLKPGDSVVEAGCGWGGLALHMARHYGARVRAFNISHEQVSFARERARAEGLQQQVEYVEDDYRNISGQYDVFASVGMLEHVGVEHYGELGEVIHRSLKSDGRGLIHSIGRNRPARMNAWIERRIFPGAQPPSLGEMMQIFEPRAFSVLDVENLRLHYAVTLTHWLERFERHAEPIAAMYDATFVRAWRLYLAGSIAAFRTGELQLFQVVFARPKDNHIPWSRSHLYRD